MKTGTLTTCLVCMLLTGCIDKTKVKSDVANEPEIVENEVEPVLNEYQLDETRRLGESYIFAPAERLRNRQSEPASTSVTRSQVLHKELSYLTDISEVAWIEIERNDVYVGFNTLPNDWEMIIKGAAVRGNHAINFGCHVWAVSADKKGWRPGDSSCYGEFTARYGRIE